MRVLDIGCLRILYIHNETILYICNVYMNTTQYRKRKYVCKKKSKKCQNDEIYCAKGVRVQAGQTNVRIPLLLLARPLPDHLCNVTVFRRIVFQAISHIP